MSKWTRAMVMLLVAASLGTGITGCSNVDKPESGATIETRNPIDFFPAETVEEAQSNARNMVANFVYQLTTGDYVTALKFLNEETCLFNENALQRLTLAYGIGRGDKVTFYNITSGRPSEDEETGEIEYLEPNKCVTVEYDLEYLGKTETVTKTLYFTKTDDGRYFIDPVAHKWVVSGGELRFQVPGRVEVYLNGVLIPLEYMGNDNIYDINAVLPRISESKDDEGRIELALRTKFGLTQTYELYFLGTKKEQKKAVSDECFSTSKEINSFVIPVPREMRESAQTYMQQTLLPALLNDITQGVAWEDSKLLTLCGEGSRVEAMSGFYYNMANRFLNATTQDGGKYFFHEVTIYDVAVKSDEAVKLLRTNNKATDYNKLQLEVTFQYQYKYNKGSMAKEYLNTDKKTTLVTLSVDDDGNWYLNDIDEAGFKYSLP